MGPLIIDTLQRWWLTRRYDLYRRLGDRFTAKAKSLEWDMIHAWFTEDGVL